MIRADQIHCGRSEENGVKASTGLIEFVICYVSILGAFVLNVRIKACQFLGSSWGPLQGVGLQTCFSHGCWLLHTMIGLLSMFEQTRTPHSDEVPYIVLWCVYLKPDLCELMRPLVVCTPLIARQRFFS